MVIVNYVRIMKSSLCKDVHNLETPCYVMNQLVNEKNLTHLDVPQGFEVLNDQVQAIFLRSNDF